MDHLNRCIPILHDESIVGFSIPFFYLNTNTRHDCTTFNGKEIQCKTMFAIPSPLSEEPSSSNKSF